jgi:hypothetical protein
LQCRVTTPDQGTPDTEVVPTNQQESIADRPRRYGRDLTIIMIN